uniref:hypothetical protein n=1 Tax=uncultured Tenacibaculum sp. TaxID=174713 RepID=UPI002621C728|nr:hypothetical protein [uncultured Tenacibaculum sp.]
MTDKEIVFLNELIKQSKDQNVSLLSKIDIDIENLINFDEKVAEKLSKTVTNILPRKHKGYKNPPSRIGSEGYVLEYIKSERKIKFHSAVVANYLMNSKK